MHITRRDVLRRLAGIATAATMLVSANFILDSDTSTFVAGRQASNEGVRNGGTAPGRLRQTTTTETRGSPATPSVPGTSTNPTNTTEAPTATAPTTTVAPVTTTTVAPVTTTVAPVTTTKPLGTASGEKFTILLRGSGPDFPDRLWNAPYSRSLPYTANVGWTDGDRHSYSCAYMFLFQDGDLVGRVLFAGLEPPDDEAAYVKVNDQSMVEKVRWFDGELNTTGNNMNGGDCERSTFAYEPFAGDDRPTVLFKSGSDLLEIRDYTKTVVLDPRVTFNQVEVITEPFTEVSPRGRPDTVYSRVTVVGLIDGLPAIVVYYDSLHSSVAVTSDLP